MSNLLSSEERVTFKTILFLVSDPFSLRKQNSLVRTTVSYFSFSPLILIGTFYNKILLLSLVF